MEVGDKLNPQGSYRKGFALKGLCQHIIKTNNPSAIGPDELLTVRFPDLEENQLIIPSTTKLTFNISLVGTDVNRTLVGNLGRNIICLLLECYMDWFPSLICKNYIFKHFVKIVEPTSLKFCTIIELITLHLEHTTAQLKYANFSYAHAQTFVLLNGEMATVSTGFRKLKFWLWLLWTVFYLNQTGF